MSRAGKQAGESVAVKPGSGNEARRRYASLAFVALFWVDVFLVLSVEWRLNEQYGYGFLVPFLGLYLIYRRWETCPCPKPPEGRARAWAVAVIVGGASAVLPIHVILQSNPDWRAAYWAHGLYVFALTLAALYCWGGRRWPAHFGWAVGMFLFAVPWLMRIEQPLVLNFMHLVSAIAVDALNFAGIHAIQRGNLIEMRNGLIGVEEACSGVRSFQSTIMGAYFLGELFRLHLWARGALLLLGVAVSFLLNIVRTLVLTFASSGNGNSFLEHWHDSVGNVVAGLGFLFLLLVAWILVKKVKAVVPEDAPPERWWSRSQIAWMPLWVAPAGLLALLGFHVGGELWYRLRENPPEAVYQAQVDWSQVSASPPEFQEIAPVTRALLRYKEGTHARWSDSGLDWAFFFFVWDKGSVSSFAGVHRPDVCMPAAGYSEITKYEDVLWEKRGLQVRVEQFLFEGIGRNVHVFYAVWDDDPNSQVPLAGGAVQRLENVWAGKRITGRRSLEILIWGAEDIEAAWREAERVLDRAMVVERKAT